MCNLESIKFGKSEASKVPNATQYTQITIREKALKDFRFHQWRWYRLSENFYLSLVLLFSVTFLFLDVRFPSRNTSRMNPFLPSFSLSRCLIALPSNCSVLSSALPVFWRYWWWRKCTPWLIFYLFYCACVVKRMYFRFSISNEAGTSRWNRKQNATQTFSSARYWCTRKWMFFYQRINSSDWFDPKW